MKQRSQGPNWGGMNTQHKHTALTRSNIRKRSIKKKIKNLTAFGKSFNISIKSLGFDKIITISFLYQNLICLDGWFPLLQWKVTMANKLVMQNLNIP